MLIMYADYNIFTVKPLSYASIDKHRKLFIPVQANVSHLFFHL
jgi:hypothetical protein